MRIHPITGMVLEDGSGALSDDLQAERIQIPYIRLRQGDAVADSMVAQLIAAEAPPHHDDPEGAMLPTPVVASVELDDGE
jgi:hypothetical protein